MTEKNTFTTKELITSLVDMMNNTNREVYKLKKVVVKLAEGNIPGEVSPTPKSVAEYLKVEPEEFYNTAERRATDIYIKRD